MLLFVHGTGVRGSAYAVTLGLIKRRAQRLHRPVNVQGCYWGQAEGARLRAGGQSIPGYEETGGRTPTEANELHALWSVLYTDPWYELRLLRHMPTSGPIPFGQESPRIMLRRMVDDFVPSDTLRDELVDRGLASFFQAALVAIRVAPEFDQAAATAPADSLDHRRAIARALVAYAIAASGDAGHPPPTGAERDTLAERVADELQGYGMSFSDFLLNPVKGIARHMAVSKLTRERGSITDAAAPAAGDTLRFLANGDGVRTFVKRAISDASEPVYLLAHSLGGIICVDLLAREPVKQVAGLLTVGSQAPFLYEIGALPSLIYPNPLPTHFPSWVNIYDRRDILSYVGAKLFNGRVTDVEVDNGQPFPQSHSAYWSNPAVWAAIAAAMQ
jgi:hypothetical protein